MQPAPGTPASSPEPKPKPKDLKVVEAPAPARQSITDAGTLLALGIFAVFLGLAALHAVLVENQAELDDLIDTNQRHRELIDQMQAEIAYLDSPEGLAEHARSVGLVPAAELVILTPVGPGLLPLPTADPFGLQSSGFELPDAAAALFEEAAVVAPGASALEESALEESAE